MKLSQLDRRLICRLLVQYGTDFSLWPVERKELLDGQGYRGSVGSCRSLLSHSSRKADEIRLYQSVEYTRSVEQ